MPEAIAFLAVDQRGERDPEGVGQPEREGESAVVQLQAEPRRGRGHLRSATQAVGAELLGREEEHREVLRDMSYFIICQ